jgi:CheY-like chemotaxis protein
VSSPKKLSVTRIEGTTTTAPMVCESMNDTPMRILLVEDNSLDVRLLREMLSNQAPRKFTLVEAGSMSEAEKHLATNKVEIILLDLGLPDARGLEAVRRAHAAAPRIPLVVLTGCDDESIRLCARVPRIFWSRAKSRPPRCSAPFAMQRSG